jgi:hypothetical protein
LYLMYLIVLCTGNSAVNWIVFPQKLYVEFQTSSVSVFGDEALGDN